LGLEGKAVPEMGGNTANYPIRIHLGVIKAQQLVQRAEAQRASRANI
jgi:hypothetical protein